MCGIAGFIDSKGQSSRDTLVRMTDTLAHRGPDGAGYEIYEADHAVVGFGHRRLSIIDLSESGKQPMQRGHLSITYNGEIYNFAEVRRELQSSNVSFKSSSDTEVILAAYAHWGPDCVDRFRGMFAFAIYDAEQRNVFFCRDRAGVKPLFIYQRNGLLLFASELKAFHAHPAFDKELDREAIALYFRYGFVPDPKCIFRHVTKLKPGHSLTVDLANGSTALNKYWDASSFVTNTPVDRVSEATLLPELDRLLCSSFNYRMVADVPVGVFLSGGYDSSLVTAMLQKDRTDKLQTFTIGFEDPAYNEANHAAKVAAYLGTDHHEFTCTETEAKAIIPELAHHYDEPFADSSAIPTFLVSRHTAASVKVALSADGGDELFGGYGRNLRFQRIHAQLNRLPGPVRAIGQKIATQMSQLTAANDIERSVWWEKTAATLGDTTLLTIFDAYPTFTSRATTEKLLRGGFEQLDNPQLALKKDLAAAEDQFNALLSMDYQSTLTNDMLVKVDRATMANGLEGREPLLDHHLYEYLANVASSQKLKNGTLKYLLKKITHNYLPPELMERPKQGFGVPLHDWLRQDLRWMVDEHLNPQAVKNTGLLDEKVVSQLVKKCLSPQGQQNNQLWLLLVFQRWCERWA